VDRCTPINLQKTLLACINGMSRNFEICLVTKKPRNILFHQSNYIFKNKHLLDRSVGWWNQAKIEKLG